MVEDLIDGLGSLIQRVESSVSIDDILKCFSPNGADIRPDIYSGKTHYYLDMSYSSAFNPLIDALWELFDSSVWSFKKYDYHRYKSEFYSRFSKGNLPIIHIIKWMEEAIGEFGGDDQEKTRILNDIVAEVFENDDRISDPYSEMDPYFISLVEESMESKSVDSYLEALTAWRTTRKIGFQIGRYNKRIKNPFYFEYSDAILLDMVEWLAEQKIFINIAPIVDFIETIEHDPYIQVLQFLKDYQKAYQQST